MELERNIVWLSVGRWTVKEVVDSVDDIENADRISFREACLLHSGHAIKLRHPVRVLTGSPPPIDTAVGFEPIFGQTKTQLATRLLGRIIGQPWLKSPFTIYRQGTKTEFEFPACEALLIYCGETAYSDSGFFLYGIKVGEKPPTVSEQLRKLADQLEGK